MTAEGRRLRVWCSDVKNPKPNEPPYSPEFKYIVTFRPNGLIEVRKAGGMFSDQ